MKSIPAKTRKRIISVTGTDRWIVSRNPPEEVFCTADVVVAGVGVAAPAVAGCVWMGATFVVACEPVRAV